MSDRLDIPAGEFGLVRVFTLELPLDEAQTLVDDQAEGLRELTGADAIDPDHIDLFDMNDLSGMALADYLAEGHGIPEEDITPHRAQLDRVKGSVMVVRSSAFERMGQTLRVRRPLRWLATFGEARPPQNLEPLRSQSAEGPLQETSPVPAASGRGRGMAWLLAGLLAVGVLALILLGVRPS